MNFSKKTRYIKWILVIGISLNLMSCNLGSEGKEKSLKIMDKFEHLLDTAE